MRRLGLIVLASLAAHSAYAQEAEGISSALSRCAGKAGSETRLGDPAFVTIALDGQPWMTTEQTKEVVGTMAISTTVTGTGWSQRRDGTSVHFRFTCVLNERGQAVLFHASALLHDLGDRLPPAIVVDGSATFGEKASLPRGMELQVQLIDPLQPPGSRIVAEQVVRSGWLVPVPFTLRLPTNTVLTERRFSISARIVVAHQTLFELHEQPLLGASDLSKFLALRLTKAKVSDR
jgi:hypothetical protein